MTGIRDVARRAGVSTATVARVLRDSPQVSRELSDRVREAVAELGYVPNVVARSLSQGRTRLLGLLVPDISNPFFAEVARGMEDGAVTRGYHVLIGSSDLNADRERQFISSFKARLLDAIAITPSASDAAHLKQLAVGGMPLVFVDRRLPGVRAPAVRTDNANAAEQAVRHLVRLGHRDIAMISGPPSFETAAERVAGFRAACRQTGIRIRRSCLRQGYLGIEGGHKAMREILALRPRPTAVFSFNNLLTVGALGALREDKVRVPTELSLLTFDDMSLFPYVDPPITAIAQPGYQMGQQTAYLLLKTLENPAATHHDVVLPTDLRIRMSCAPPASRP